MENFNGRENKLIAEKNKKKRKIKIKLGNSGIFKRSIVHLSNNNCVF